MNKPGTAALASILVFLATTASARVSITCEVVEILPDSCREVTPYDDPRLVNLADQLHDAVVVASEIRSRFIPCRRITDLPPNLLPGDVPEARGWVAGESKPVHFYYVAVDGSPCDRVPSGKAVRLLRRPANCLYSNSSVGCELGFEMWLFDLPEKGIPPD